MIVSTTNTIEGRTISEYRGVVSGEVILGANVVRDIFASFRDFFGGRSRAYERVIRDARNGAIEEMVSEAKEMGADAVLGVDIDYETVGKSMLMVTASGTAVRLGR